MHHFFQSQHDRTAISHRVKACQKNRLEKKIVNDITLRWLCALFIYPVKMLFGNLSLMNVDLYSFLISDKNRRKNSARLDESQRATQGGEGYWLLTAVIVTSSEINNGSFLCGSLESLPRDQPLQCISKLLMLQCTTPCLLGNSQRSTYSKPRHHFMSCLQKD